MSERPALYLIGGPTASGKTAAALDLAAQVNGVIINADAMQVYKGLPILTAQPAPEEQAKAPHSLFAIIEPSERFSVGHWLVLARKEIDQATQNGKTPILVGGTGLYFSALLGGLAEIPTIPQAEHEEAVSLYNHLEHDAFRAELAVLDPISASQIKPNDRQRLIRAYEVVRSTGAPLSHWHDKGKATSIEHTHTVHRHLLLPDRKKLYTACDARFLRMVEHGALDEVKAILSLKLDPDLPAMKILGVPELAAYLRGELSREEAITKAQQATRNYAKRQMTWFRNQWDNATIDR